MGIFARRLHATTCANESGRGFCRVNNPFMRDLTSIEGDVLPSELRGTDSEEVAED